jgi:hypothetical protein
MTVAPEGIAAASSGTLIGLALAAHNGVPTIFVILVIALALFFGIWSASSRSTDPDERRETMRMARTNAGALFVISVSMPWILNLSLPTSCMTALVIGLVGSKLIEKLESTTAGQGLIEAMASILAWLIKGK